MALAGFPFARSASRAFITKNNSVGQIVTPAGWTQLD